VPDSLILGIACALIGVWAVFGGSPRVAVGLAIALLGLHVLLYSTLADDAFITFRYARNLADGHGPVFNPGQPVEGYSNFLQMIVLAAGRRWFGADIVTTARVLGTVCAGLTIWVTWALARRVSTEVFASSAALMVAVSGSVAAYAASGLETSLFALLVTAQVLAWIRGWWILAGLLLAAGTMTRPEGILMMIPAGAWLLSEQRSALARTALAAGVPLVIWTMWRVSYYGYLLPNAMVAKMGMDPGYQLQLGALYVLTACMGHPFWLFVGAGAILASASTWRRLNRTDWVIVSVPCLYLVFIVAVGGDWMPAWRFVAPFVPLSAVAVALICSRLTQDAEVSPFGWRGLAGTVALTSLILSVTNEDMVPRVRVWNAQVSGLSTIGRWLHDTLPADTLIATYASGALPYYADLPTIDVLGLTDAHIARNGFRERRGGTGHVAHDYPSVAARRPDLIVLTGNGFDRQPRVWSHPAFATDYRPVQFQFRHGTNPLGQYVSVLVRTSRSAELVSRLDHTSAVARHLP